MIELATEVYRLTLKHRLHVEMGIVSSKRGENSLNNSGIVINFRLPFTLVPLNKELVIPRIVSPFFI